MYYKKNIFHGKEEISNVLLIKAGNWLGNDWISNLISCKNRQKALTKYFSCFKKHISAKLKQ